MDYCKYFHSISSWHTSIKYISITYYVWVNGLLIKKPSLALRRDVCVFSRKAEQRNLHLHCYISVIIIHCCCNTQDFLQVLEGANSWCSASADEGCNCQTLCCQIGAELKKKKSHWHIINRHANMQLFSEYRCKERKAGSGRLVGTSVTYRVMKMTVHQKGL